MITNLKISIFTAFIVGSPYVFWEPSEAFVNTQDIFWQPLCSKGITMLDPGQPIWPYHNQTRLNSLKTTRIDEELVSYKEKLKHCNRWDDPQVAYHYRLARVGTPYARQRALQFFEQIFRQYREIQVETNDFFVPYATAEQISNQRQGIHVLDQFYNDVPLYAPDSSLPLAWLIPGRQGGGKSSASFHILFQCRPKSLPMLLLDPKGTWKFRAQQLCCEYIESEVLSLDLDAPSNTKLALWLFAYMEGVAAITGLQYSISYLNQACDISLRQRETYQQKTGVSTPLSLKDIYWALGACSASNPKEKQYLTSAQAALETLIGKNSIFSNRGGLSLEKLLGGNYILGCRYLSAAQCRLLAWHLLAYEYFRSFNRPETTQPVGVILFDDSSKFVSKPDNLFSSSGSTSAYLHILSNLRSTGRSVIFVDQIVDPIYADIKQLCSNWLVVGGLQGSNDLRQVQSAMNLTDEQMRMLVRLQTREAVCFCPTLYPRAIHGWIPEVPPPQHSWLSDQPAIISKIRPWHPLTEIPEAQARPQTNQPLTSPIGANTSNASSGLEKDLHRLCLDVVTYLFDPMSVRIKRLQISGRTFERVKQRGIELGFFRESAAGMVKFLIPHPRAYEVLKLESETISEHQFYTRLICMHLRKDPAINSIRQDVSLSDGTGISDILATYRNGRVHAYEITLSTTNLLKNLQKYSSLSYTVHFVCRDYQLKQAVSLCIRESGLAPDVIAKARFHHIYELIKREKLLF